MSSLKFFEVFLVVLVLTQPAHQDYDFPDFISSDMRTANEEPLPKNLKPTAYDLRLVPYIKEGYFNGSVYINVTCEESTNTVVLHAHTDLLISDEQCSINYLGSSVKKALHISSISRNKTASTLTLTLEETLQKGGLYQLYFVFSQLFVDVVFRSTGFVRETYVDEMSMSAGTFMIPRNARNVYPCFDEPSLKAVFKVTVKRLSNMTAFSVMPLESTVPAEEDGWVWDSFRITPPLSTFSVNILVTPVVSGNSQYLNASHGEISVQQHYKQSTPERELILRNISAIKMLQQLQDYLATDYPFPKLDVVMNPDLLSGLHLNSLGLTYLAAPLYETVLEGNFHILQNLVFQYIIHTMTPENWTAFNVSNILGLHIATDLMFKIYDKEEWKMFLLDEYYMRACSSFSLNSRAERLQGAGFFYMLTSVISEATFRRGLSNFLSANKYRTYTEDMLWDVLTHEAHADGTLSESVTVRDIKRSWLNCDNFCFPVVTLTRNYDSHSAIVKQHIFRQYSIHNLTEEGPLWYIPISYVMAEDLINNSLSHLTWMKEERQISLTSLPDSNSFIIVNHLNEGIYIVNYDQHNWDLITHFLMNSRTQLPTVTRNKLLNDAFSLAMTGELDYGTALNITLCLHNDTELIWKSILSQQEALDVVYRWSSVEDKLSTYFRSWLAPLFESKEKPREEEHYLDRVNYQRMFRLLAGVGYNTTAIEHRLNLDGISTYPVEDSTLGVTLYCPEFMRNNSDDVLSDIAKLHRSVGIMKFELNAAFFLKNLEKCEGYTNTVERVLSGVTSGATNRSINYARILPLLIGSPNGHNMTLNLVLQQLDAVKQMFHGDNHRYGYFIEDLIYKIHTQEGLNRWLSFWDLNKDEFQKHDYIMQAQEEAVENVKKNLEWRRRNIPSIENWLDNVLPHFSNHRL